MLRISLLGFALMAAAAPVRADRIAPIATPVERALRVPVVVVGKVTAIEKETIDAPLHPGQKEKVAHKIAVVKVETNLLGAENTTHLKVGFVPSGAAGIRPGRGPENPELKEGQEWLFFLTRNPGGAFYSIPYMTPPMNEKDGGYKSTIEGIKVILAAVKDPTKALRAKAEEKGADRFATAIAVIYKFRTVPEGTTGGVETVALSAEESRAILLALTEGNWLNDRSTLGGYRAFSMLGLTEKDGWKPPPARPSREYPEVVREAFVKWLKGPGKDYRIKKLVPKKGK